MYLGGEYDNDGYGYDWERSGDRLSSCTVIARISGFTACKN